MRVVSLSAARVGGKSHARIFLADRPGTVTVARLPRRWRSRCWARRGSAATASRWRSTHARRRRCSRTSRWPTGRARARRCASCCGPTRTPSTRAARCGARCRRCARRSASSGSTPRVTASRCATAPQLDVAPVPGAGGRRRGRARGRRRGVPRRAARGVLRPRQPGLRRVVRAEADALQRELGRGARAAGAGACGGREYGRGDPLRAALARARRAARAGAPRADPALRARRRPGGRAGPVPGVRAHAQPGARRGRRSRRPRRCSSR